MEGFYNRSANNEILRYDMRSRFYGSWRPMQRVTEWAGIFHHRTFAVTQQFALRSLAVEIFTEGG